VGILSAWQASQIASDLWLSHWTGQKDTVYDEAATQSNIPVYVGLCGLAALFILARSMTRQFSRFEPRDTSSRP
jgi:hypothetical protein